MKNLAIKLRHGILKDFRRTLLFNLPSFSIIIFSSSSSCLYANQRNKKEKKQTLRQLWKILFCLRNDLAAVSVKFCSYVKYNVWNWKIKTAAFLCDSPKSMCMLWGEGVVLTAWHYANKWDLHLKLNSCLLFPLSESDVEHWQILCANGAIA